MDGSEVHGHSCQDEEPAFHDGRGEQHHGDYRGQENQHEQSPCAARMVAVELMARAFGCGAGSARIEDAVRQIDGPYGETKGYPRLGRKRKMSASREQILPGQGD